MAKNTYEWQLPNKKGKKKRPRKNGKDILKNMERRQLKFQTVHGKWT